MTRTGAKLSVVVAASLILANCGSSPGGFLASKFGTSASPKVVAEGERVPVGGGYSKVGKPYIIAGRLYQPSDPSHYSATGLASWYGEDFHGRMTANGEVFNIYSVSAAHPTLPLPSYIRVTNTSNGRSIVARVNDRGPFHSNRLVDVSERVAEALGFHNSGTANVKIDYLGRAPQEGSDDARLIATLTTDGTPAMLKGNASASLMTASADPIKIPTPDSTIDEAASEIADEAPQVATKPEAESATPKVDAAAAMPALPHNAAPSVPLPPSRNAVSTVAASLSPKAPVVLKSAVVSKLSTASKPVMASKAAPQHGPVLSLKTPLQPSGGTFKTAQAQVPVPAARPQGLFYAQQLVPPAAMPAKRLTPQTFVPVGQPQTF